jgi:hypothetical protein
MITGMAKQGKYHSKAILTGKAMLGLEERLGS